MLSSLSEAYPRQLATAIGVDVARLWKILHGDGRTYSSDLSPIALGLVEVLPDGRGGRKLVITAKGRRKARQVAAGWHRDHVAKEARRALRQTPQVHPQAPTVAGEPVPAPAASVSFTWTHT